MTDEISQAAANLDRRLHQIAREHPRATVTLEATLIDGVVYLGVIRVNALERLGDNALTSVDTSGKLIGEPGTPAGF